MEVNRGDIILWSGSNPVALAIRFLTKSKWSHCAWVVDDKYVLEALPMGVARTPLSFYMDPGNKKRIRVLRIREEFDPMLVEYALQEAESYEGSAYDYRAFVNLFWITMKDLVTFGTRRQHKKAREWRSGYYCAELVARPLFHQGLLVRGDIPVSNIVPGDLTNSLIFKTVNLEERE